MRVTQAGLWGMVRQNLSSNASRTREVEEQAVTGLLVNRPSDAPALLSQIDRLNATTMDQDVYQQNAGQALAQLNQMDNELGRVHAALTRVRELVVQASGDVISGEQRGYIALEVEALRTTVLQAANSNFAGRYLFAGTAWDAPPFDDAGAYAGSTAAPRSRVGADTWVETGLDGSTVFQGDADILAVLDGLVTALNADDTSSVEGALSDLDASLAQVMTSRAAVGTETNVADDAVSLSAALQSELGTRMDELVQADPAETYMKLSQLRTAYSTALQVAASAKGASLFDLI
jgi:flagellar hook-associated protein 3 FlgL